MTAPLSVLAEKIGIVKPNQLGCFSSTGFAMFDTFASLTSLIVGILGATGAIGMPAAAAYALIGVSCGITLLWTGLIITACKECIDYRKNNPNQSDAPE